VIREIAVDLGTANTNVAVRAGGPVVRVPSVVALEERTGAILAVGDGAWAMLARQGGGVTCIRPFERGSITDFDLTERLLAGAFERAGVRRFLRPRALIAVSSTIGLIERRAVREAAVSAGVRAAELIDVTTSSAIGAGLPIERPGGSCIVHVGGGTTEAAIVSLGGVVSTATAPVGGFDLDAAVRTFLQEAYGVIVGERAAEELKIAAASAHEEDDGAYAEVSGRDLESGAPKAVRVSSPQLRQAIHEPLGQIIDVVRAVLTEAPPDLAHDVIEGSIVLAGGGALLRGLARRVHEETGVPARVCERPAEVATLGAMRAFEAFGRLRDQGILGGA